MSKKSHTWAFGDFSRGQSGYVLVYFNAADGEHAAWLHLAITGSATEHTLGIQVYDWVYEDTPDTLFPHGEGFPSGEVPEPASVALTGLGLLALGATGIRRHRKQREDSRSTAA